MKARYCIIIKWLARIIKKIYLLDILCIKWEAKTRNNLVLKLMPISFENYCKNNNCTMQIVEERQRRKVYEPEYYSGTRIPGGEYMFETPPIYITEIESAFVHGGSGLVIVNNKVLTDLCDNDPDNRVLYKYGPIRKADKNHFYLEVAKAYKEVDTAINLCGLAADNYYHLTIEILSRYEYVKNYYGQVPVLLDERTKINSQFRELINCFIPEEDIIYVEYYSRIFCKKIVYPSMNTWMPINLKDRDSLRISDNIIAKSAITNIRKNTERYMHKASGRKIFVSRKNTNNLRIINELELVDLFKDKGYEIVYPEELSFFEQIALFSEAICVVGSSGAAMTNLVYCNAGTVFGCIIPMCYHFNIYSSIAMMCDCKVLFLDTTIIRKGTCISEDRYIVDIEQCVKYIAELEKLVCGNTKKE